MSSAFLVQFYMHISVHLIPDLRKKNLNKISIKVEYRHCMRLKQNGQHFADILYNEYPGILILQKKNSNFDSNFTELLTICTHKCGTKCLYSSHYLPSIGHRTVKKVLVLPTDMIWGQQGSIDSLHSIRVRTKLNTSFQ